jgi:type II secretory pathway component PulF
MKFVKFGSSFRYCMNKNNSTKDKWKMALKDPAYLMIVSLCVFYIIVGIIFITHNG